MDSEAWPRQTNGVLADSAASAPPENGRRKPRVEISVQTRARTRAAADHHRPTEKLFGCDPNQLLPRDSHDLALRQQAHGGIASADAPAGTTDASIQIRPSGTTVSFPSWRGPQFVPARTPPNQIPELPILAIAILYNLANNDRGLRSTGNH